MAPRLPFLPTGHPALLCQPVMLAVTLTLTACLPGEGDVAANYNRINQRAAVENAALSLYQAAQAMTAYRVAAGLRRKQPLGDGMLTELATIEDQDNPKPIPPLGVSVVPCGKFGALAYFNQPPKGLPPLNMISSTMARTLAARFGGENVGFRFANGQTDMPALTKDMDDCTVGPDILPGSPIAAAGFQYQEDTLPDRRKVTWPSVDRTVTVRCPAGFEGVIKREKKCTLIFNEYEAEREKGEILIGGDKTPNPKSRMDKTWRCESNDAPPTADEILKFCRNPADGLTKPDDNAIEMNVDSLQQILSSTGPGYYTFKCRRTATDPTACDATPYTPTLPNTFLRCDKVSTPPLYVTNPVIPLTLDASGDVIGNPAANLSCGRGWTGKLTARYLVRRCNLYQTVDGGAPLLLRQSQTIYHITYAAAQCSTTINTTVQCPVGNTAGRLPVVRRMTMVKPVALDWRPAIPGTADWSTSTISTNDSRLEIKEMAAEKGFIVPDTTRAELEAADTNTEWALKLAAAMERRDPSSMDNKVVACDNTGEPCKVEASTDIRIVVDQTSSRPLASLLGGTFTLPNLQCVAGTGTCHPLLGRNQPKTCSGECLVDTTKGATTTISGGNYELLLESYLAVVTKNLPPDVTITVDRVSNGNSLTLFTDLGSICDLAAAKTPRLMVFGYALTNGNNNYTSTVSCPALSGQAYNRPYDLLSDAISSFVGKGGQLRVYSSGEFASLWATAGIAGTSGNELAETGSASQALADWIKNPIGSTPVSLGNPCDLVR